MAGPSQISTMYVIRINTGLVARYHRIREVHDGTGVTQR
jgi:hypothetical protein